MPNSIQRNLPVFVLTDKKTMKKFILLLCIVLFGASAIVSQTGCSNEGVDPLEAAGSSQDDAD